LQSTITLFGILATFGTNLTATKYVAERRDLSDISTARAIKTTLVFSRFSGLAAAILLFSFSKGLATDFLDQPSLETPLAITSASLFFIAMTSCQQGVLSGLEQFRSLSAVSAAGSVLSSLLTFLLAIQFGITGLAISLLAGSIVNFLLTRALLISQTRTLIGLRGLKFHDLEFAILYKFSLPALIATLSAAPFNWACEMIVSMQNSGLSEMATYGVSSQIQAIVLFLPAVFGQVFLAVLASSKNTAQRFSRKRLVYANVLFNFVVLSLIAISGTILSGPISVLYGGEYIHSGWAISFGLWTAVLMAVSAPFGQLLIASGKMWTSMVLNLLWGVELFLFFLLLFKPDASGLLSARLFAFLSHCVISLFVCYRLPEPLNDSSNNCLSGEKTNT
jgi:O-antigen/teichoic acid export membrane protein